MEKRQQHALLTLFIAALVLLSLSSEAKDLPKGFVYLRDYVPDAVLELRYLSNDNFVGEPIDGYLDNVSVLTEDAALALQKVQADLKVFGLGLKVFDTYRPQSAVDHFVRWANDLDDIRMKARYYPEVQKENLFSEGYIAGRSGHSRGSTVDVTIIDLITKEELDMGSGFDFFSPLSWPTNPDMTTQQRANRMLLQILMVRHGFLPYDKEWWHFTLKDEPFPDQYFDFPVQ